MTSNTANTHKMCLFLIFIYNFMAYIGPLHWSLLQVGFFVFIFFCRPSTSFFFELAFLSSSEKKEKVRSLLYCFSFMNLSLPMLLVSHKVWLPYQHLRIDRRCRGRARQVWTCVSLTFRWQLCRSPEGPWSPWPTLRTLSTLRDCLASDTCQASLQTTVKKCMTL